MPSSSHIRRPSSDPCNAPHYTQGVENGIAGSDSRLGEAFEAPFDAAPPRRRPAKEVNFTQFSFVLRNKIACSIHAPCELQVSPLASCM